jgi:hypothetical protein
MQTNLVVSVGVVVVRVPGIHSFNYYYYYYYYLLIEFINCFVESIS